MLALVARRRAERRRDRAAAAAGRRGRLPPARAARPARGQPLAGHADPAAAARRVATAGSPWRRSLDLLSDRALWRMVALPGHQAAAGRRRCASSRSCRSRCSRRSSASACRASAAWATSTTSARGRSARASASCCCALASRRPRCSRSPTLEALYTAAVHDQPRAAGAARRAERAGARDAGREPRRPLGLDRLLAARPRGVRRRARPPGRAARARARGARGPRSSATAAAVAAIVHDAALDTSPELVQAAAAASSLAIDNERLKADLRARVEELRVSRLRIVEAADDGAAADRARPPRRRAAAARRASRSSCACCARRSATRRPGRWSTSSSARLRRRARELRELARGIHPAILTDRGLAPAIAALADRAPVPVERRRARSTSAWRRRSRPPPTSSSPRR